MRESVLGQRCVLSVIQGRPSEGEIDGRRRRRTNGSLVFEFRSGDFAMTAARGLIGEMSANATRWIEPLSPREKKVFEDLIVGHSNRVIAGKLNISPRTVEIHRARVMKKLQAQSLPHLVRMAIETGTWVEQNKKMTAQAAQRIERLTPREKEVFVHLVIGHSNREIAANLNISPRTVEVHRARVIEKMQVQSLPQLVRMAYAIEAEE